MCNKIFYNNNVDHRAFVRLSLCRVGYVGSKSRTERPGKTKIDPEVAHITRDSDTTFKVKRSKVNLQGAGAYCGGLPHSLLYFFFSPYRLSYNFRCLGATNSGVENGQYGLVGKSFHHKN